MKLDEFTSTDNWTILTPKVVVQMVQSKYHLTTSADVMLITVWQINAKEKARGGRYCISCVPNNESYKNRGEAKGVRMHQLPSW